MPRGNNPNWGFQKGNKIGIGNKHAVGRVAWNKGMKGIHLSPSTEIKKGQHLSENTEFKKGHKNSIESIEKVTAARRGLKFNEEWKKKISESNSGEKNCNWQGGISKDNTKWNMQHRHKLGISKRYNNMLGISKTKEYKSMQRHNRRALVKGGGKLGIKIIQLVYEDNIKKYGTLTCYLCLIEIEFKKDHLEHKTPLSRGGTNLYENLGVACQKCNCRKHTKTEEEYREEILQPCL